MEKNGGMVAVVQGLRDSSLTVTLLDGGRQYTLMPNDHAVPRPDPPQLRRHPSVNCASQYAADECSPSKGARNRENGIQATDGRYASTYKMMHCNVSPTSPQQTVTEFPPQRPEVLHGHGNFVIGGSGSGETARPSVKSDSFRGGLVWPDKGSVCASKPSVPSDPFANSLRKYPNITPERSSEIVQRLISFTQAKNISKFQNRCPCSPTRNSMESESSKQTFVLERNSSRNSVTGKMIYPPEVNVIKKNRLGESSPVRQRSYNYSPEENDDAWNRPVFCNSNDVRCFRDTTRKVKQGLKNLVVHPPNQFNKSSSSRIRDQNDGELYRRRTFEKESHSSVNMEIQAAARMESKEILTLPRIVPMQRTVATPLSPIPSKTERWLEEERKSNIGSSTELMQDSSYKSIQVELPQDSHIKTTSSSIDIRKKKYRDKRNKRSRSEEELSYIKKSKPGSIFSMVQEFNNNPEVNRIFNGLKGPVIKKKRICQNCKLLFEDFDILRRSVSNNTYFGEDFQCNINQQKTRKHFNEMSSHYDVNGYRVDKDYYCNGMQKASHNKSEFLSHIDAGNYETMLNDTQDMSKFSDREKRHGINEKFSSSTKGNDERFEGEVNMNNKILSMTQEEIRNLIDLDILAFTEKYHINITTESLYDLIEELINLFVMDFSNSTFPNKEKIKIILKNRGLSEFQSIYLTNILTEHWEEEFLANNNLRIHSSNFKPETLIVLPNIIQDSSEYKVDEHNTNNERDFSIKEISKTDVDANIKLYENQISNEINEWLSNLQISETRDKEVRRALVNDLASDIIDRHKYLELNPSSETSETSELEHLKYQIFKLFYKFGIGDIALVDYAIDLMDRIRSIAVPVFSLQEKQGRKLWAEKRSSLTVESGQPIQTLNIEEPSNLGASTSRNFSLNNECCRRPTCKRNLNRKSTLESNSDRNISLQQPTRSYQPTTSTKRMSSPSKLDYIDTEYNRFEKTPELEGKVKFKQHINSTNNVPYNRSALFSDGIQIRDDESDNNENHANKKESLRVGDTGKAYNQYLKEWVENIPLPMSTVEEQTIAATTRIDVYNGILEAISKLRSEKDTCNNRFLFEDKLDEVIEKIMNQLPPSLELTSKKHILKVKLIDNTSNINDLMKSSANSYKQQLVETLKSNLPEPTVSDSTNPDIQEIYEELQILNLVEDFIIFSRYQDKDPVLAEAYRNKLIKRTENFVQELKANHQKALKNIDAKLYFNDILDTLRNVPLPSNDTVQKEADQILLSIEIDKWFSDLPLVQSNDFVDQLHRRKLKNNLAKQILDIEKGAGKTESMLNNSLKHEISQFLAKAPLQQDESLNINSMVDELIKRLKEKPTSNGNDFKKVVFNEPDYEHFSKNIPLCSTYTGQSENNMETQNRSALSTNSREAFDESPQVSSGHYHNISEPLFNDPKIDQNCCNTDLSLNKIPDYETFNNTRPRSSSLKNNTEPHWYTLQESKQEQVQTNISPSDIRKQLRTTGQSNKSIQAISPSEQSHKRHYHNIAQPLLDDLRFDSNCCNDELVNDGIFNGVHPRNSSLNDRSEANWYTLQESKQRYSQLNKFQSAAEPSLTPYPISTSQLIDQDRFNRAEEYHTPEQEFNVPQRYLENVDPNFSPQPRRDIFYESRRNSPRILNEMKNVIPIGSHNDDARESNHLVQPKWSNSHSHVGPSTRESPRINQRSTRLDQVASPHRTHYQSTLPKESFIESSLKFQGVIEEQRSGSPQMNRSDLFYRSTDPDGRRQTIERNKGMEVNTDKGNPPECIPRYYQPSVLIPPGYVPLRLGTKKAGYMTDRNIDEGYQEDEESEEENDEDGIRCRCVEKMWKNKRRYRYCPFEQYEGFPMCVTSPYFYPYFY